MSLSLPQYKADLSILGGGLVGGLAALALSDTGLRIQVIEHGPPLPEQPADYRTTALAAGSVDFLKTLGLWDELIPHSTPIDRIDIREQHGPAVSFEAPRSMGYMVSNHYLRAAIFNKAVKKVSWFHEAQPTAVRVSSGGTEILTLKGTFQSSLLLGADGRRSWMRKQLHLKTLTHDYHHIGLTGLFSHPHSHQNTAVELFTPYGPFALLPMDQNRSGFVWSVSPQQATFLKELSAEAFSDLANGLWQDHRGPLTLASERVGYPLELTLPTSFVGPRWALLGDAAHTMHPVAGQGLNVGIRDVMELQQLLAPVTPDLFPHWDLNALLQTFQKKRRWDHWTMAAATHGVLQIFETSLPGASFVRRMALGVTKHFSFLRKRIISHAMGEPLRTQTNLAQTSLAETGVSETEIPQAGTERR